MAKLENYKGSIDLISGLRAKNNGDFPLMEAHDILVDESGKRLDEALENMGGGGSGAYVLELTDEQGTLTDEQYNAVVANAPNVYAYTQYMYLPLRMAADGTFVFMQARVEPSQYDDETYGEPYVGSVGVIVMPDKTYQKVGYDYFIATKEYVDSLGGGGSYVLELSGDSGTLTDEQYNQLVANAPNVVVKNTLSSGVTEWANLLNSMDGAYQFEIVTVVSGEEDGVVTSYALEQHMYGIIGKDWFRQVNPNNTAAKSYVDEKFATKTYVDNAVANAGGGGSSGGLSIKSITFTDRPTAYAWLCNNHQNVIKTTLTANILPTAVNYPLCSVGQVRENGSIASIVFTNMQAGDVSQNRISLWLDYLSIYSDRSFVNMGGHVMSDADTVGNDLTEIQDEAWASMSVQLTCYYIE